MNRDKNQRDTHIVIDGNVVMNLNMDLWIKAAYLLKDKIGKASEDGFNVRLILENKLSEPDTVLS